MSERTHYFFSTKLDNYTGGEKKNLQIDFNDNYLGHRKVLFVLPGPIFEGPDPATSILENWSTLGLGPQVCVKVRSFFMDKLSVGLENQDLGLPKWVGS